jgi:adenylate kinase
MYIVLIGAPGAGKGTQASIITKSLDLVHIASGDLFRQAINQGTPLGLQVKPFLEAGKLVPDKITVQMVLERIMANDIQVGAILDGFPRNLEQAKILDKSLADHGKTIDQAVYIKVSEQELVKRLSGRWICRNCQTPYHLISAPPKLSGKCDSCGGELYQRADDTPSTVRERLTTYFNQTVPLIDYYRETNRLREVDGEGEVDDVGNRIITALRGE